MVFVDHDVKTASTEMGLNNMVHRRLVLGIKTIWVQLTLRTVYSWLDDMILLTKKWHMRKNHISPEQCEKYVFSILYFYKK